VVFSDSYMDALQLVGRSEESAVLASCLSAAAEGGKSAALIRGRPGFGKTHLLVRFAREAQRRGILVARSSLGISNRSTPYSLWIRTLEDLLVALERDPSRDDPASWLFGHGVAALSQIVPHLVRQDTAPIASVNLRSGVAGELLLLLARVAARRPLLLLFDNLQFADDSSLAVFGDLCSSLKLQRDLTLCATVREPYDSTSPHLAEAISGLMSELEAFQLTLKPFTPEEVAAYLAACGADAHPELVSEVYRTTEGNPLFLSQFGSIDARGCRDLTDAVDPALSATVEERILEYFRLRMNELNETTRSVLCAASVLGGEFGLAEIAAAAGEDIGEEALEVAVREAVTHSFLDDVPNGTIGPSLYRFHHELLRKAVIRTAAPRSLQAAHRRMAVYLRELEPAERRQDERVLLSNLLSRGKRIALIGDHLLLSASREAAPEGVDLLLQAGDCFLAGGAWEDAEAVFSRIHSEQVNSLSSRERARVEYGLGKVRLYDGRKLESFPYLEAALEHFAAAGETERMVEVVLQPVLLDTGHAAFLEILRRAITALAPTDTDRLRLEAYCAAALALVTGEYQRSARILTEQVTPTDLDALNAVDGMRARAFLAYLDVRVSRFAEARRALNQVEELLSANPDPVTKSIVLGTEYEIARDAGKVSVARDCLLRRLAVDEAIGDRCLLADSSLKLGRLALKGGDWSVARRYFNQALRYRTDHALTLANLVVLECALGRYDAAEELLRRLLEQSEAHRPGPHAVFLATASALTTTALFSSINGDPTVAEARLLSASRIVRRVQGGAVEHPFIATRRLVLSSVITCYLRRSGESAQLLGELSRVRHHNTIDSGHIERARGLLHYLRGSRKRGEACLRRAASHFQKRGDLVWGLLVEYEYAVELRTTDPVGAELRIDRLHSTCENYGMVGLVDRLLCHRRQVGSPEQSAYQAAPSFVGQEHPLLRVLTVREREVLGLLAAGLSDKEIAGHLNISIHTASNHVRHILAKSGSSNRTQAVARLSVQ
jgi:DNA-binding CsgD family transcriptional regulator/tetratricopeptide (TPR) repeat protein